MAESKIQGPVATETGTATKVSSSISEVEYARYVKCGKICEFQFKFTVSTKLTSTEALFSGLPAPALYFALPFCHNVDSATNKVVRLRIGSDGIMREGYSYGGGIDVGQWEGNTVYITQN